MGAISALPLFAQTPGTSFSNCDNPPMLVPNLPYYVVMSFTATMKSDGSIIRFLPGETVHLKTNEAGTVSFESGKGTCECSTETFRFGTMKLFRG